MALGSPNSEQAQYSFFGLAQHRDALSRAPSPPLCKNFLAFGSVFGGSGVPIRGRPLSEARELPTPQAGSKKTGEHLAVIWR